MNKKKVVDFAESVKEGKIKIISLSAAVKQKLFEKFNSQQGETKKAKLEKAKRIKSPLKRVPKLKLPFKMASPIKGHAQYSPQLVSERLSRNPSDPHQERAQSTRRHAASPRAIRFLAKTNSRQLSPPKTTEIIEPLASPYSPKKLLNLELWEASASGNIEKLTTLINPREKDENKADINSVGVEHRTALHWAVYENKTEAVLLLLQNGADIEALTEKMRTPLHIACILGHENTCEILLKSNANLNAQDKELNTPCHYAAYYNNLNILRLLFYCKPDITLKNNKKQSAIDCTKNKNIITCFWEYLSEKLQEKERIVKENSISFEHKKKVLRISKRNERLISPVKYGITISTHQKQHALVRGSPFSTLTSASRESIPDKIGLHSFKIIRMLGKGSFGEVYLVQMKSNQKFYAMKVLLKNIIVQQNLVRYAYTEKNILAQLRHPFIVSLKFSFQSVEKLFLVQDFCPGGDLKSVLEKEKKITEDRARIYTAEVLLAIEELHNREIIYRDLKPENVLLDAEGHALLSDFGLSKEGVTDRDITQSFCGSVAYLAPEMLERCGHGKAVDWYLLGVLLYELIVGIPPYFYKTTGEFTRIKIILQSM